MCGELLHGGGIEGATSASDTRRITEHCKGNLFCVSRQSDGSAAAVCLWQHKQINNQRSFGGLHKDRDITDWPGFNRDNYMSVCLDHFRVDLPMLMGDFRLSRMSFSCLYSVCESKGLVFGRGPHLAVRSSCFFRCIRRRKFVRARSSRGQKLLSPAEIASQ